MRILGARIFSKFFGGKLNKCLREDWGKTYSDSQFNSFSFQKRVTLQNVYVYIIQLYSKN